MIIFVGNKNYDIKIRTFYSSSNKYDKILLLTSNFKLFSKTISTFKIQTNLTGLQTNEEFYNLFSNDIPIYIILKTIRRSQQINILVNMKIIITHQYPNPHEDGNFRILFL